MTKRLLAICTCLLLFISLLAGCCSKENAEPSADLVFSDVEVECANRDGFFGGRYANFKISGSVTNNTENPVNKDNMPRIITNEDDGAEIKPRLSENKLLSGETCDISYEGEFNITHDELPSLSFNCKLSTEGIDTIEAELNEGLGKIADEYASKDAEIEAEVEAIEKAIKSLEDCTGKTADEGLEAASKAKYTPIFEDKHGVDVTSDVEDTKNESDVHNAKITSVDVSTWGNNVTFILDYEDPEEKKKREEEAAKEAAEIEEAEKAKKAIEDCKGKTADTGLKTASDAGYSVYFEDKHGTDVTSDVEDKSNKSAVHKAKITSVDISTFFGDSVTFTLDYEDPEEKKKREEEAAKEKEANKVLTAENCEDLARLLNVSDQGDPFISEFAKKYAGRKIEFDATIIDVAPTGKTRFDFLLMAGDGSRGPYFKFADKHPGYDFHWKGNVPENVSVNMMIHCVATVGTYNEMQELFFLTPVETSLR